MKRWLTPYDCWRSLGRTDIPVVRGAVFPLVHRRKEASLWQAMYGKVAFAGAWDDRWWHERDVIPHFLKASPPLSLPMKTPLTF